MSFSRCSRWDLPTPRTRFHEVEGKSRREPPIEVSPIATMKFLYHDGTGQPQEKFRKPGNLAAALGEDGERRPGQRPARGERDREAASLNDRRREERDEDGRLDQ